MNTLPEDERWMRAALGEARRGVGRTAPNPPTGAVVVRDGALLGRGWHQRAGAPHAEREALATAVRGHGHERVRGSTVYVTLEPCSSHGRTPPCTDALLEAGVARVVYACRDLDPRHCGRADAILENAGVRVTSGVCEAEARDLLRPFFKVQETGLPWVVWKCAASLDGRLTRPDGEGPWLTGDAARADVQRLRAQADAILTSGETVRRDHPRLTIRDPRLVAGRDQPWRVVLSNNADSLPRDAPLFTDEWSGRTRVMPGTDLRAALRGMVVELGVLSVMVEAGGRLAGSLFAAGLVDEVVYYVAPLVCGGPIHAVAGLELPESIRFTPFEVLPLGADMRLRARVIG